MTGLSEGKQERETRRMGVCLCVCMSILSLCVEPWRLVGRRLEGNRQGVPSPGFPLQPVLQRRWRCVGSVRCVAHLWLAPPSISACPTAGDPKFCTQCGQGLAPGAKFCSECGEAHFSVPLAAAACKLPWTRLDLSAPLTSGAGVREAAPSAAAQPPHPGLVKEMSAGSPPPASEPPEKGNHKKAAGWGLLKKAGLGKEAIEKKAAENKDKLHVAVPRDDSLQALLVSAFQVRSGTCCAACCEPWAYVVETFDANARSDQCRFVASSAFLTEAGSSLDTDSWLAIKGMLPVFLSPHSQH